VEIVLQSYLCKMVQYGATVKIKMDNWVMVTLFQK